MSDEKWPLTPRETVEEDILAALSILAEWRRGDLLPQELADDAALAVDHLVSSLGAPPAAAPEELEAAAHAALGDAYRAHPEDVEELVGAYAQLVAAKDLMPLNVYLIVLRRLHDRAAHLFQRAEPP